LLLACSSDPQGVPSAAGGTPGAAGSAGAPHHPLSHRINNRADVDESMPSFQGNLRHHNDLWLSIAQAYFKSSDPLPALAQEIFHKQNVAPIPGLWSPVA
jgi:hypothetical protein